MQKVMGWASTKSLIVIGVLAAAMSVSANPGWDSSEDVAINAHQKGYQLLMAGVSLALINRDRVEALESTGDLEEIAFQVGYWAMAASQGVLQSPSQGSRKVANSRFQRIFGHNPSSLGELLSGRVMGEVSRMSWRWTQERRNHTFFRSWFARKVTDKPGQFDSIYASRLALVFLQKSPTQWTAMIELGEQETIAELDRAWNELGNQFALDQKIQEFRQTLLERN